MVGQTAKLLWKDRQEAEQSERQARIKRAWDYYEGRHAAPLAVKPGQVDDTVLINLARPIVDKGVSFLFGKPVAWQADETAAADSGVEQYLAKIWTANDQQTLLQELAQNGGLAGLAAIKADPQPDGAIDLINLDPSELRLFHSAHNINDIQRYRIEYTAADADGNERNYRQDITRQGPRGSAWIIQDYAAVPGEPYRLVGETPWPYPLPPIVHCKNLPCANAVWGYGDLEDAKLNDSLNLIASATRKIVRLHAHPRTWGRGFTAKSLETWGPGDMWTVADPQAEIKNLEMQSDLAAARQFYIDLRDALYVTSRIPDLSTLGPRLGQITNFGLHVLFADLIEKNETKRVLYGGLIVRLNRLLALIGGYGDNVTTTLTWPDPLPEDGLAKTAEIAAKQKTGLVSDETLTAELGYRYADEQKRLTDERAKKAAQAPQPPPQSTPGQAPGAIDRQAQEQQTYG